MLLARSVAGVVCEAGSGWEGIPKTWKNPISATGASRTQDYLRDR